MQPMSRSTSLRGLLPRHPLFRLLVINGLAGATLGVFFVFGILTIDVAGIRTLLTSTGEWVIGLALLTMGSVTTFASVAMGGAIMLMPKPKDPGAGGRRAGMALWCRCASGTTRRVLKPLAVGPIDCAGRID